MSFDSRALPTNAGLQGYDFFVRGQAWELAESAPGPEPRVYTTGGSGDVRVAFDARSPDEALERCERALRTFMPNAPRLAGSMDSAASVVEPCRACSEHERGPAATRE